MEEGNEAPSRKRVAGREISRDNPGLDDNDCPEPELGTFKRASKEVMANRRIVKVRRQPQGSSSNPFANISFTAPTKATERTDSAAEQEKPLAENSIVEEQDDANDKHMKALEDKMTKNDDVVGGELATEDKFVELNSNSDNPAPEKDMAGEKATLSKDSDNEVPHECEGGDTDAVTTEAAKNGEEKGGHETGKEATNEEKDGDEAANEATKNNEEKDGDEAANEATKNNEEKDGDEATKNNEERDGDEAANEATKNNEEKDGDEVAKEIDKEDKEAGKNVSSGERNQDADRIDKIKSSQCTPCLSSFQQLSSNRNAFTGLAGTGFSSSTFSFGSKDGPAFGFSSGSMFGNPNEKSQAFPAFGVGSASNGRRPSVQLFGSDASGTTKNGVSSTQAMKEVAVETGEENENVVFNADAILFEYIDGGWKERGKGEIRVNVSISGGERARLVMRARGNYRLILNSSIYPDMSLKNMDKRGITFACVNSAGEGKGGLATFALKFKDSVTMEEFRETVTRFAAYKEQKEGNTITDDSREVPIASND